MLRIVTALGLALAALAAAPAAHAQDRYALAGGCYGLKSLTTGAFAVKTATGEYRVQASQADAERFHLQATELGRYLLYGRDRDFLARGVPEPVDTVVDLPLPDGGAPGERIQAETAPSESGNWVVNASDGAYRLSLGRPSACSPRATTARWALRTSVPRATVLASASSRSTAARTTPRPRPT